MAETKKTGGLAGVTAGKTALCTVGKEGAGLTYCGYDIYDLADNASFEEVAYLLLHGKLPTRAELDAYVAKIKSLRGLPDALKVVLEMVPAEAHPMDVLRTGVSFLGNIEPEASDFSDQQDTADRLLACLPSMMVYWHRFHTDGVRIDTETDDNTIAGHILHMLHDKAPPELHEKSLSTTLILYAEHEFNASTFAGRVITGTLSDMHSAVSGAIGALRGPLHGGANEAAMELIQKFSSPGEATEGVHGMLERRELIMGFGHRVYTTSDPRNSVNKAMSKKLAEEKGDMTLYEVSEAIEKVMWDEKKLFANADFFAASVYHFMGIPTYLFTPIFVCSRITGWAAHVMEQRADNKLIRPAADYVGPPLQAWVAIDDR
jgi:2-methylcitrate synthase